MKKRQITNHRHGEGQRIVRSIGILETIREVDEAEEPIFVFDKSDNGKWISEEAVVDCGAVECVMSKRRMPYFESGSDARITTRRNVDMRRRH